MRALASVSCSFPSPSLGGTCVFAGSCDLHGRTTRDRKEPPPSSDIHSAHPATKVDFVCFNSSRELQAPPPGPSSTPACRAPEGSEQPASSPFFA
ncbi:unnamed protein product [Urochloa humidicola]